MYLPGFLVLSLVSYCYSLGSDDFTPDPEVQELLGASGMSSRESQWTLVQRKKGNPLAPLPKLKLPKTRVKRQEEEADVPAEEELPPFPAPCDFGSGEDLTLCLWSNPRNRSGKHKWKTGKGTGAYWVGGPKTDHSTGDLEGGFAFFETSFERARDRELRLQVLRASAYRPPGAPGHPMQPLEDPDEARPAYYEPETALLISHNITQTGPDGLCVSFWFTQEGLSAGLLRILLFDLETGKNRTLWESYDGVGEGLWQNGEMVYTYGATHKIIFEAVPKQSTDDPSRTFRGYIALDDIVFHKVVPGSKQCLGHCTFEGSFCSWRNSEEEERDQFNWELARGSQSFLTGPARDFSSFGKDEDTGGYTFIDASYPRRPGDIAELHSPPFSATGDNNPFCMRFATHMFGNGIGTLKVLKLRLGNNETEGTPLWEISGEGGNSWYIGQVPVSSPAPFELIFEATVGTNPLGNIAVDNVSFRPGTCPISPQTAAKNSGNCDFEEDTCGWNNAGTNDGMAVDVDWARQYSFNVNGPSGDHTKRTKDGYYMNLLSNHQLPLRGGTRAWLVSGLLQPLENFRCIAFFYFMYERTIDPAGPSLGSLRIYVRSVARDSKLTITPIWRLNNHQGQRWLPARAAIGVGQDRALPTEPYQVIIEGIWGDGRVGFIAIDDISFFDGDCTAEPSKAQAVIGECSFEQDMCTWTNISETSTSPALPPVLGNGISNRLRLPFAAQFSSSNEALTWRLATPTSKPANLQDHTFRAPTGYVFFDIFNQPMPQSPVLTSQRFEASNDGVRCLSFWFAPYGRGEATTLSVVRMNLEDVEEEMKEEDAPPPMEGDEPPPSDREVVWKLSTRRFDSSRPEWTYGQVSIITEAPHQIFFEGESTDGGFALDDITFYEGNCDCVSLRSNPWLYCPHVLVPKQLPCLSLCPQCPETINKSDKKKKGPLFHQPVTQSSKGTSIIGIQPRPL